MYEEALFKSADEALTYAFRFSNHAYDRPMMNRMADGPHRSGKGLVGLDGSGQAGMIRAEIKSIGDFHLAIVTARYAPSNFPCDCRSACCSGRTTNWEWSEAIDLITRVAIGQVGSSNHRLRRAIVVNAFLRRSEQQKIGELADYCNVHRDTASDHNAKIMLWLCGMRSKKNVEQTVIGEIDRAKDAAQRRLYEVGFIGLSTIAA